MAKEEKTEKEKPKKEEKYSFEGGTAIMHKRLKDRKKK